MSENLFIPKMRPSIEESDSIDSSKTDVVGVMLHRIGQYLVVALFGAVLLFFTPQLWATLGFDKVILTTILTVGVLAIVSIVSLRRTKVTTILPLTLLLFWMTVFAAFASAVISSDSFDSLRGSFFETQTVGFFALLALVMSVPLLLQGSKDMTIKALLWFGVAALLSLLYIVLRLLFGPDLLPLQSFGTVTNSPVGTFNDQAIFAGLIILMSLITLIQLPLKAAAHYLFAALIAAALFVLAVANFKYVWIVVGFFSLLLFVFVFSRDRLFKTTDSTRTESVVPLFLLVSIICVVSGSFLLAGDVLGKKVQQMTNVEYVEVRPSIEATIDIAQNVYQEKALFGMGANRFTDAWRQYKDPAINETIFWDTDFSAGSGFVPTVFVTLGLLGGLLLVGFHGGLLYTGYRMLLRSGARDPYWYFLGSVSFGAACFLWGMSYIYVPGATVLILAALFSGLTFVAAAALLPYTQRTIPLVTNRRRGFFLMAIVIVLIVTCITTVITVGTQYLAQMQFNKVQATADDSEVVVAAAKTAYAAYPDDRFLSVQAQIHTYTMNQLLGVNNPTEEQQKQFIAAAEQALESAEKAERSDHTDPDHHALLASVFSGLAAAGVEGAAQRMESSLKEAMHLDPQNPGYYLAQAQVAARTGDNEIARITLQRALELKRDFTPAMYLLAQLAISDGNVEEAIATTRSIITLEPRNPTRYFQLGVLLSANNALPEAVTAFQSAIALDPQYANARYLLALAYLTDNNDAAALVQLRIVQETNQDNQELLQLIAQVESGEYVVPVNSGIETPITETVPQEEGGNEAVTIDDLDSPLLTSVNQVSTEELPVDEDREISELPESTANEVPLQE